MNAKPDLGVKCFDCYAASWHEPDGVYLCQRHAHQEREIERLRNRLVDVLLAQAINQTAEVRKRLLESENIPAEIWEMRLQ